MADILPEPFLTDIGCSVQNGPRDSSTVAVKRFGGGFVRFACADVPRDSVAAAIGRYREAGASALGGASAQSGDPDGEGGEGGLIYLYTTYSCDLTHIWEWDPFVGLYVYQWTTGECTFREFYWDPNVGGPTPPPPPPTDSLIAPSSPTPACTSPTDSLAEPLITEPAFFELWDATPPEGVKVCRSTACIDSLPGVWVGAWPIPSINGLRSHAAVLTTPPRKVDELLGWTEYMLNHFHSGSAPYYGAISDYKWVRVGELSSVPAVQAAVTRAQGEFAYEWYTLGSNRFISNVLKYSNLTFTEDQYRALGKPWGICRCPGVCNQ